MTCEQYWELANQTLWAIWYVVIVMGAFFIGYGIGKKK